MRNAMVVLLLIGFSMLNGVPMWADQREELFFERDVLPIFRKHCTACHNEKLAEGGLAMETVDALRRGGDSGEAIDVAQAVESLLIGRVRGEIGELMPPEDNSVGAQRLSAAEISTIENWIAAGAKTTPAQSASEMPLATARPSLQPLPENLKAVYAIAISPTQTELAVGRGNQILRLDLETGKLLQRFEDPAIVEQFATQAAHRDYVNALAYSPDGRSLASAGFRTVKIWQRPDSPIDGGEVKPLIAALADSLLPSGGPVAVESTVVEPATVEQWLRAATQPDNRDQQRQQDQVAFLESQVAAASERVATEEAAKTKAEQAAATAAENATAKQQAAEQAQANLTAADESSGMLEELRKAVEESEQQLAAARQAAASAAQAAAAALDVFNQTVARTDSLRTELEAEKTRLIEIESARVANLELASGHTILAVAESPNLGIVAVAVSDGPVWVFDATSGQPTLRLRDGFSNSCQLRFVGQWLLAKSSEQDSQVKIWDTASTWRLTRAISGPETGGLETGGLVAEPIFADAVLSLAYSPDGKHLVAGGGEPSRTGEIHVFDTADYRQLNLWENNHSDAVLSLRFSPDGRTLATSGADKQVRLVDFPSGDGLMSLEGHTHHVTGIDWQDHGRRLASASVDQTVKVWNARSTESERTITVNAKQISGIVYVGKQPWCAVITGAGFVRIYNTDDGAMVRELAGGGGYPQSVASDRAGKSIAAGYQDGTIRCWNVETGELRWQLGTDL